MTETKMAKLRVTARDGRYLPGLGSRAFGEYFEVPQDDLKKYKDVNGLEIVSDKRANKPAKEAEEEK